MGFLSPAISAAEPTNSMQSFMAQRGYQAIHMERKTENRFLIRGKLNDVRTVFAVDTGANVSVVDFHRARKLPELGIDKGVRGPFGFHAEGLKIVAMTCMDLNGVVVSNQPARVLNLHHEMGIATGSNIPLTSPETRDVVLGIDFLRDTHALLDCGTLTLYLRGQQPGLELQENMEKSFELSGYVSVQLRYSRHRLPCLPVVINGIETELLLDTGGSYSVLESGKADDFHISMSNPIGKMGDVGARQTALYFATVSSLKIGKCELRNFPIGMVHFKSAGSDKPADQWLGTGSIGPDLLGATRALIDCSSGKLYLRPGEGK